MGMSGIWTGVVILSLVCGLATGRGPEQRPDAFDDYGAALFGGTTSFLDTGEGLEERLATLASRDDDRRAQEELKAALLEAARNMQTAQEQPLKVELHSTLELESSRTHCHSACCD